MLIAGAERRDGEVVDLRLADGAVAEVGPSLRPRPDEDVLDAAGSAVLPGLHDHHVHLRATAAAAGSLDLAAVGADIEGAIRRAAAERPPGAWLRVVGYHEPPGADGGPTRLDRRVLDGWVGPDRPVRVQHRGGSLWILNTAALAEVGLLGHQTDGVEVDTGRLWRRDDLLRGVSTLDPAELAALGRRAAALGVTGFTDATPGGPTEGPRALARDLRAAGVGQRLHLMGPVGARSPDVGGATLGPVKVLLDDDRLPALDDLTATVDTAHAEGRAVAVHCVTRVQLVLTLAALEAAGPAPGDRIEHASVTPPELLDAMAAMGITVVTQPHFVTERGDDYRHEVAADDLDSLYRVASPAARGIPVAAGTDAPFGAFDPWASMRAAIARRTPEGHVLGADERIGWPAALGLFLGEPGAPGRVRTLEVGAAADLCVLGVPWRGLDDAAAGDAVRCTIVAGEVLAGG